MKWLTRFKSTLNVLKQTRFFSSGSGSPIKPIPFKPIPEPLPEDYSIFSNKEYPLVYAENHIRSWLQLKSNHQKEEHQEVLTYSVPVIDGDDDVDLLDGNFGYKNLRLAYSDFWSIPPVNPMNKPFVCTLHKPKKNFNKITCDCAVQDEDKEKNIKKRLGLGFCVRNGELEPLLIHSAMLDNKLNKGRGDDQCILFHELQALLRASRRVPINFYPAEFCSDSKKAIWMLQNEDMRASWENESDLMKFGNYENYNIKIYQEIVEQFHQVFRKIKRDSKEEDLWRFENGSSFGFKDAAIFRHTPRQVNLVSHYLSRKLEQVGEATYYNNGKVIDPRTLPRTLWYLFRRDILNGYPNIPRVKGAYPV